LTGLAALALMAYYNTHGKKTGLLGNAVVSFNVALPFFFGGLAVGNLRPLLFIFFLLAFLANMAREIAKGIGVDPQNIQIQPDTKFLDPLDREKAEIRAYMTAIRTSCANLQRTRFPETTDCTVSVAGPVGFEPTTFGSLHFTRAGARCPILVVLAGIYCGRP